MAQAHGNEFDNAFVREAERVNSDNMRSFRKEAASTTDPDIHSFVDHFLAVDANHEAAAAALSDHVVASKSPVVQTPPTGDTINVVPPHSDNSMPVIVPPPSNGK